MHELPVAQNILEIGINHARKAEASKIISIYLSIGQFASIIDDSIQFYWSMIAKNTIAEDAKLFFNRIPAKFECLGCHKQFNWDDMEGECPFCKDTKINLISGTEFFIEAIDVE